MRYWKKESGGSGGIDYLFSDFNSDGYPSKLKIDTDIIPRYAFNNNGNSTHTLMLFSKMTNIDIKANSCGYNAFNKTFYSNSESIKIKLRVSNIECPMFDYITNANGIKVWLSNEVTSIDSYLGDFTNNGGINLYCETDSKPTGWYNYWNCRYLSSSVVYTTMWGVSESAFDAL